MADESYNIRFRVFFFYGYYFFLMSDSLFFFFSLIIFFRQVLLFRFSFQFVKFQLRQLQLKLIQTHSVTVFFTNEVSLLSNAPVVCYKSFYLFVILPIIKPINLFLLYSIFNSKINYIIFISCAKFDLKFNGVFFLLQNIDIFLEVHNFNFKISFKSLIGLQ